MLTIGLNQGHDASAAFVRDGELLFAAAEERYTRKKHQRGFPLLALSDGFRVLGVDPREVDAVVINTIRGHRNVLPMMHHFIHYERGTYGWATLMKNVVRLLASPVRLDAFRHYANHFGQPTFIRCDHHLAHALSAYGCSGFSRAAVLVVDGQGDYVSTSMWRAEGQRLRRVFFLRRPNSLGYLYQKCTTYLGYQPLGDEWKVMGLAAYGAPGVDLRHFIDTRDVFPYQVHAERFRGTRAADVHPLVRAFGPPATEQTVFEQRYRDIAFALQQETERGMLNLVRLAVEKTGCHQLCLAGGVALNCVANGKILTAGLVDDLFIQPAAGDDGTAIGAALAPFFARGTAPQERMRAPSLGPSYTSDEVETVLRSHGVRYERPQVPEDALADLLADGKIVALFQGRMEFGPRALGNRSILADPRRREIRDRVNQSIKYREWWRPLAPSITEEAYADFFDAKAHSPFMILSVPVRPEKRSRIEAVVHVDGSARPQSVQKDVNPLYWRLLTAFAARTGVPVLLNTSFNVRGEPIVCSPEDALRTFLSSGLDALCIEGFLVRK